MFFNNSLKQFEILNRNHLKYIVIIFMLIDHICYFYPPDNPIVIFFNFISRLTAPTMALFIAEGYYYTRDVHKYMERLLIFAVISYIPYVLFYVGYFLPVMLFPGSTPPTFYLPSGKSIIQPNVFLPFLDSTLVIFRTSVIFTLFLGLVSIYLWDRIDLPKYIKLAITLVILWIGAFCHWQYFVIVLCLNFYFLKDNPKKMWLAFIILAILRAFDVRLFLNPFCPAFTTHFELYKLGIFLVPVLFALYNGQSGSKSAFNKWFFYIFYPAHLLILGLIRIFM